jgi:acyl-homoserine-lactone acylase
MRRAFKWIVSLLAVLLIASAIWEPLTATRQAPPPPHAYDARIVRDEFGVPHIFGKTDADAAYGLAYAHAEDDFGTIAEVLAMTRGRAGAYAGAKDSPIDYAYHLLGARETVDKTYDQLPADVRAVLEAYAAGVNRYADRHPGEVKLAKLFPTNGHDVATGFVLRSPFFFGLDHVMGNLVDDQPPPPETAAKMTPAA